MMLIRHFRWSLTSSCRRTEARHDQGLLVQNRMSLQLDNYIKQSLETLDVVDYLIRTLACIVALLDRDRVNNRANRRRVWKALVNKGKFKKISLHLHPDKGGGPGAQIMVALTLRNGGAARRACCRAHPSGHCLPTKVT